MAPREAFSLAGFSFFFVMHSRGECSVSGIDGTAELVQGGPCQVNAWDVVAVVCYLSRVKGKCTLLFGHYYSLSLVMCLLVLFYVWSIAIIIVYVFSILITSLLFSVVTFG